MGIQLLLHTQLPSEFPCDPVAAPSHDASTMNDRFCRNGIARLRNRRPADASPERHLSPPICLCATERHSERSISKPIGVDSTRCRIGGIGENFPDYTVCVKIEGIERPSRLGRFRIRGKVAAQSTTSRQRSEQPGRCATIARTHRLRSSAGDGLRGWFGGCSWRGPARCRGSRLRGGAR
jgi:hypothetical protein